jgi:hypothetical protein
LSLPAHFNPRTGATGAAKHFQWFCVDAAGNQRVVSAFKIRTGNSEDYAGLECQELLARSILHPASGIVDMNKPHAGTINQVDRVDYCIHGPAEASRPLFTALHDIGR